MAHLEELRLGLEPAQAGCAFLSEQAQNPVALALYMHTLHRRSHPAVLWTHCNTLVTLVGPDVRLRGMLAMTTV
jgi:hypothetical protein